MQRMRVRIQMTIDKPPQPVRAMHLAPHKRTMRDMIRPIHVQRLLALQRDLQADDGVGAVGVRVELPRVVLQEGGHQLTVVAFGGLPGEAEDVEAAVAGAGGGWGGAAGCPSVGMGWEGLVVLGVVVRDVGGELEVPGVEDGPEG